MALSTHRSVRVSPSAAEEWMMSLTAQGAIGTVNPENPSSVVSAIRFLLQMSIELDNHGNYVESVKCAESALLLRHVNEATVTPLLAPLIAAELIPRGRSRTVDQAEDLVLCCNNHAVAAFNEKQFLAAEFFLGKALFLTDLRGKEEANYFIGAESRRLRLRAATLNNLGCMEKRRQRLEESLGYLRQAVELEVSLDTTSRGSPSTYLNLCTVLNELSQHHEAVNAAENAIAALEEQMSRQNKEQLPVSAMMLVVGLYNLGVSLEHRGRDDDDFKARAAYNRALEVSRRHFVDPNCPTVELAMAAVRRMHAETAFHVDRVEAKSQRRKKLPSDPTRPLKPLPQEKEEQNLVQTLPKDLHEAPEKSWPQLQQQPPKVPISPLVPVTEAVAYDASQSQSIHSRISYPASERSVVSVPFASPVNSWSRGAPSSLPSVGTPASVRSAPIPIQAHTVPGPAAPRAVASSRVSIAFHADIPTATGQRSSLFQSQRVPSGDGKQPLPRPAVLAPIVREADSTPTTTNTASKGERRLSLSSVLQPRLSQKAAGSFDSVTASGVLNPFSRRVFENVASQDQQRRSSVFTSLRSVTGSEAQAMEKHVRRSMLQQSKAEEAKRRADVPGRRGSAAAKAKEREQKRLAREEARNDAEMAEVLYEKFVNGMRADKLNRCHSAAIQIQRIWRGCLARTLLYRMVVAARKIQRVFRVYLVKLIAARRAEEERLAKIQAEREKQEMGAAIVLQVRVRQFLRRLEIRRAYFARKMRRYYSARRIQRGYRAYLRWKEETIAALMEAQRLEERRKMQLAMNAARRIQWVFKRYLRRKEEIKASELLLRSERAAAKIQALVRGVLARAWFSYYKLYRRQQELRSAANQKRIILIQACARVLLAVQLRRLKEVDLLHRLHQAQLRRAATKIQCQWRLRVARIKFERLLAEHEMRMRRATKIQRWYATCILRRRFLEVHERNRRQTAALKIKQWYHDRKLYIKEKELARYHAYLARRQRLALLQAQSIVLLQAWGRCFISTVLVRSVRSSFLRFTLYTEVFQRIGRGYAGRRLACRIRCRLLYESRMRVEHHRRTVAACVVQRAWRCAMAKDTVELLRRRHAASLCISKHYRGYMCRKELVRLRQAKRLEKETRAVLVMQRAARQFLQRLELVRLDRYHRIRRQKKLAHMRREEAAVTFQAAWRGRATRMALERERKALEALAVHVVKIQQAWRTRKFRRNINAEVKRRSHERMSRSRAALTVQCFWRKMMAAEEAARLRELSRLRQAKAAVIQSWWRRFLAKWELEALRNQRREEMALQLHYMERWENTVTLVNTALRVCLAQQQLLARKRKQLLTLLTDKERERFLSRNGAAIKIQAVYRGHYERVYARGIRREKEEEERCKRHREALEKRSAVIIQCAYRSWRALREANARRAAKRAKALEEEMEHLTTVDPHEVVRQLFWVYEFTTKRDLAKISLESSNARRRAAEVIQRGIRQWLARRQLAKLRREKAETHAAKTIQAYWIQHRSREMQKSSERECRAAVIIQAHFRGSLVRREWEQLRKQMAYEQQHKVLDEEIYDRAATTLQSFWRRIWAQHMAEQLREERRTIKVQQVLDEAASTIQRAYRHYRQRRSIAGSKNVI
ncbi:putative Tetratricopeptide repeat [Trypanosoma cruzi]|nr:putative Tetratricopeptide repeat [Trypanosoma cruzi]